jgi:hypothetical protein
VTGHEDAIQYLADRWLWVVLWLWLLGGFSWAGKHWRQVRRRAREAAEVRHRRRVELELARRGLPWPDDPPPPGLAQFAERWTLATAAGRPAVVLPAAVIPAPPGAQPVLGPGSPVWTGLTGAPGACRHERIVPVIGSDGELHRWVCANFPRCDAKFDKSVAVYDEPPGTRVTAYFYAAARGLPCDLDYLTELGRAAARRARWLGIPPWRVLEGPLAVHAWPEVWAEAGMAVNTDSCHAGKGHYLCLACLARRLGRALIPEDFPGVPVNALYRPASSSYRVVHLPG